MSKPVSRIRKKSQTRAWEKERRNRLNEYFKKLWEVLPIYDSSKPLSKADTIIHATSTIKDLDEKLKNILVSETAEKSGEKLKVSSEVIKKLQDRVKKLLLRVEQLVNILSRAGIRVPSEYGPVKKLRRSVKYANAITTEQQEKILQKELEKENQGKRAIRQPKLNLRSKQVVTKSRSKKVKKQLLPSNCLFVVSQVWQPTVPNKSCFILSKTSTKLNKTVLTNSMLVKSPIVSSSIKPSLFPTPTQLSGFGPGTLLFADGTMMPVVPTPRPLPALPTIFANPIDNLLSTIIAVSSKEETTLLGASKITTSSDNKTHLQGTPQSLGNLPVLRPKPNITRTTQVNKVPIPSLSSKNNKHVCLDNKKSPTSVQPQKGFRKLTRTPVSGNSIKKESSRKHNETKNLATTSTNVKKINDSSNSIPASESLNHNVGDVSLSISVIDSTEKATEKNKEKSPELSEPEAPDEVSKESLVGNNDQNLECSAPCNENTLNDHPIIEKPMDNQGENEVSTSESLPAQPYVDEADKKIIKSYEITNFIPNGLAMEKLPETKKSAATNFEQSKTAVNITKESLNDLSTSNLLTTNCSISYDLTSFATFNESNSTTPQSNANNKVSPSINRNVLTDLAKQQDPNSLRSEKSVTSRVETQTNGSLKVTHATSLTASDDSLGSKPVEMRMPKSYDVAPSCQKQESKAFEFTNLSTGVITHNISDLKTLEINLPQADLSNDIFASFQVAPGCQNPESTSPTAAFLLAFPLVSSGVKVTEVMGDENPQSQTVTPNLLQVGTMDISKPTQSYSESLTPNLLNFDNFSFFNSKDNCSAFYNNGNMLNTTCHQPNISSVVTAVTLSSKSVTTLASSMAIHHHFPSQDDVNKDDQSKSANQSKFPVSLHYNKSEIVRNKQLSDNNKLDVNVKNATPEKFRDCHVNFESAKGQPVALVQSVDKVVSTSQAHMSLNVLDMNSDIFSFKSASSTNYLTNNKHSSNSNVPGLNNHLKSSSVSHYSNYRRGNSSVTTHFGANRYYPPVYNNAANTNTFCNSFGKEGEDSSVNNSYCGSYIDYNRKSFTNSCYGNSELYQKEKVNQSMHTKVKTSSQNKPINWMTTPSTTASYKADYFLPQFPKEPPVNSNLRPNTLSTNTYFNSSVYNPNDHLSITQDFRKSSDISLPNYGSFQRTETEDNRFSWSPNKMPQFLDTNHANSFVSSTLPTLVGDLALNNTPTVDQKNPKDRNRDVRRKTGHSEIQSSFLSVSQLVEQANENMPAKVVSRRSSGNRSKTNTPKAKRICNRSEPNKEVQNYQKNEKSSYNISVATNLFNDSKQPPRNNAKHITSSYSAEALIGNQASNESSTKRIICQNKAVVPSFFNDNVASYFPPVEGSQDTNYIMHGNQNYQSNSFPQNFTTTYENNSYGPNNSVVSSSYLPTNNFLTNTQDYVGENANTFQNNNPLAGKEKCNVTRSFYRPSDKEEKNQSYSCKKVKKRPLNDNVLPSFDIHFFSMPGTINSPILPDDFHTTYLPPTTLYSCKNPLYSKSNSEVFPSSLIPSLPTVSGNKPVIHQHSQMSPSVNSAGTSLTNFNLSTIFPEINKGPVQELYSDNRNKDYNPVSKSFSQEASQVPFRNKPSTIF